MDVSGVFFFFEISKSEEPPRANSLGRCLIGVVGKENTLVGLLFVVWGLW